jgi:hypothetical protein
MKESQKQADLYNSREALFGMEPTDYHGGVVQLANIKTRVESAPVSALVTKM